MAIASSQFPPTSSGCLTYKVDSHHFISRESEEMYDHLSLARALLKCLSHPYFLCFPK